LNQKFDTDPRRKRSRRKKRSTSRDSTTSAATAADDVIAVDDMPPIQVWFCVNFNAGLFSINLIAFTLIKIRRLKDAFQLTKNIVSFAKTSIINLSSKLKTFP